MEAIVDEREAAGRFKSLKDLFERLPKGSMNSRQLEALIAAPGVDLDIPNDKMQHPLHFAAFKQHPAAVAALLAAGASTMVLDRKGRTPAEDTADEGIRAAILEVRAALDKEPIGQLN